LKKARNLAPDIGKPLRRRRNLRRGRYRVEKARFLFRLSYSDFRRHLVTSSAAEKLRAPLKRRRRGLERRDSLIRRNRIDRLIGETARETSEPGSCGRSAADRARRREKRCSARYRSRDRPGERSERRPYLRK
jgi:hypothetical protein